MAKKIYELSDEEKEKAKELLDFMSKNKNNTNSKISMDLPTANMSKPKNEMPVYDRSSSIDFPRVKIASQQETKNLKKFRESNNFTDTIDNVTGVLGNIGMGIENVIPNISKYMNEGNKIATKKATSTIIRGVLNRATKNKEFSDKVGQIVGNTLGEKIHSSLNPIAKTNQELNNADIEKWRTNTIQNNISKTNNFLGTKLAELAPSIGNNALPMAVALAPVPGARALSTAMFMTSAGGSYLDDAKARGMNEDEAFGYATIMGTLEGGTEAVISGNMLNKGVKLASGHELSKEILGSYGLDITENFAQEAIMEPLSELTATITGGKESADWNNMGQRMINSGIDGALSAVLLSGVSAGIGSAVNVVNKHNNGQAVTQNEIKTAMKDIQNSGKINVEEVIKGSIEAIKGNNNINVEQNSLSTVNTENTYSNQLKQMASKEITNSNISEDYKTMMLDVLNNMSEVSDADISSIRQNINSLEDANNNKEKIRSILKRNGTFSEQIDKYVENKLPSGDFLYLGETPTILKKIGLNNEEMVLKQGKLKSIIKESSDGTDQMHGLPIETIKKIPEAIANPLNVLQSSSNKDSIVVITDLADTNERPIIASIEVNYNGQIGNIDFLSNRLTSAYGKNNYDRFMKTEIAKGNLLYDIDEGIIKELPTTRLQLPKGISSSVDTNNNISTINNSISQNNNSVKNTITDNYMQKKQNNSNELETSEWTKRKKDINPSEISSLSKEDSSTTPKINPKKYEKGNRQSNFYENVVKDSQFINKDFREEMSKDENIRYYKGITNEQTLQKAYESLKDGGKEETLSWFSKNEKNVKAEDVAKGWILLKQYQDAGDYQGAVEVAKKMRQIGTNAGQAVQAYNILSRLTPEGMFYYAQSELNEAYSKMVEGKSKQWIEANQDKFNLTQEETQTILDTMKEVTSLEDGREKNIKLAQIQKLVSDKIPPTTGQSVKAWMRISMLFNPKTQVRNVMGNAVVLPVNATSDVFAGALDKLISKKTGVRTTGVTKEGVKGYAKGFKKGVFESYDDFRKGINTRNVEGNRFEIGEGKSFKDKGIGKALNRVDNMLSFALDVGDRGFYEATYTNSINNQMILNNTTEITQDMIDIATNEALQRTWQDSNNYTQAVLSIRKILNKANVKGYGLGDVLIPFAKTPANLTKAIVDYSPVGLTKTLAFDAKRFTNSLQNGQYSPQLQHDFVQNVGKGLAGTMLYTLGYALAKADVATGEPDDDKDVKNFMKNSLGISSYSIKIGDKSFTYDWAQPVATPLAIMTNYVKYSKDNPDASAIDKAIKAMNIGTEQLLQQSFMESLNTVLNGNGTTLENLSQAVLELPARAVPTFCKQIADMVDGTQRSSFEYGQPIKSAINSVKAKIPGLSQTLPASVDTLGNDIQKYGGNNNLWNVMLNPANTNKGQLTKTGQEIYNVYMNTGDSTIFPRTAPYYINNKGEKITMSSEQRNKFQRVSGKYVEESLDSLLNNKDYKNLNNNEKASIINEIVSDSYSKAKYDVLEIDSKEYLKTREILKNVSPSTYYNYKIITKGLKKDNDKIDKLVNSNYSNNEKTVLYETYILSDSDTKYPIIKNTFTENGLNITKYLQYKSQKFTSDKKDDGTVNGKSITGSKKDKVFDYIYSIKGATYTQKLILYALEYRPRNASDREIVENYVRNMPNRTVKEKLEIMSKFAGVTLNKPDKEFPDGSYDY